MGVCLGEVSNHQQHHRERAPPPGFVLYHQGLAAQKVKKQNQGLLYVRNCVYVGFGTVIGHLYPADIWTIVWILTK